MTKGILFFALNNSKVDYTKLAVYAAEKAKKFLNVPVTIATDDKSSLLKNDVNSVVDTIIEIEDTSKNIKKFFNGVDEHVTLPWKNGVRYTSYDISPYDETLVLDVDYIVNSETLTYCWNNPHDFLIYKQAVDFTETENVKYISDNTIPFYWATVFYFKKTEQAKAFFDLVLHIKNNWNYYRFIYYIYDTKFRNDHAFSIAIHMLNGFSNSGFVNNLPGKLYYVSDRTKIVNIDNNVITLLLDKQGTYVPVKVSNLDLHIMNKFSLLENI